MFHRKIGESEPVDRRVRLRSNPLKVGLALTRTHYIQRFTHHAHAKLTVEWEDFQVTTVDEDKIEYIWEVDD